MDQGSSTSKEGGSGGNGSDSPSKDKPFDPSIDMLVNDFDDERTLEEEEALAAGEDDDPEVELSNLEREGNMPLDQLLAMYGYNNTEDTDSSSEEEEEELFDEEDEMCELIVAKETSPTPPRHSRLSILYEPLVDDVGCSRSFRSGSRISDDEEEYGSGAEEDRKGRKTIMVGGDYQALIPEGLSLYDNVPPYENEDQLMWAPQENYNGDIEEYLGKAQEMIKPYIPDGYVQRDDEDALYLLQQCDYNIEEALKRLEMQPIVPPNSADYKINDMIWAEEECRGSEAANPTYNEDFFLIPPNMIND